MSLSSRSMSKIGDNLFSYKIEKLRITNLIPRVLSISSSRVGLVGENSGGRMNKLRHSKDKHTNKQPQNEREKWEKVK